MISIGIVGKTNVGKSSFFSAATLKDVEIADRPFVTINPNEAIGYVKVRCVHTEFNVKCNPKNSVCIDNYRFIPIKLVDVAGLIPGAHEGRGLGNKFLDDLRQADALIHVIDASGSTNEEGLPVEPGSRDPEEDIKFIENELDEWFYSIINKDWAKFARTTDLSGKDLVEALLSKLSGISVNRSHIIEALKQTKLENLKLLQWTETDLKDFARVLRIISKPMIIAANKSDMPQARRNIEKLRKKYQWIIPTSAISELALRKAAKSGIIHYIPGESDFIILKKDISEKQKSALEYIRKNVLEVYGSTGVQQALNVAVFEALKMIVVYPVEDEKRLSDKNGNVLPDAILLKKGSNPRDLAYSIHTDLAKGFLYAIDVKRKMRIGEEYQLQDGDVIKIVSSTAKPF
ncbi:redox-regulated ATPase YchF [Sulfolobus sp. A20]|uniref:redox-regulated ATPase YchF n=1 Tax=Sulfolobaceae TaxID=118883 RepID=UPI000845F4BF|nr:MULTISPECIES: redox-regulated ATPase YchF [unclassified Sulfolobus]TRM86890.1 redox-regulated ATPase YchF [Sulfolobus sp. E3]TRM98673.1 redox-regulated ATPase YchF [Sulfolobus sp. F1]TRN00107.1 redox-regulated ATPase YchF [Sulfolobus sp. E1]AOL15755.1 redox-regulated ATPase YchF [Sulfolobus sp. A20]TRM97523.1 redox-regulated ATPase YchF [Sulfolobus sp. B1]